MHGRLKVKTTAQQEAEKKAERAEKVKNYRAAMRAIFSKREAGELDAEMIKMTAGVLLGNPDINTLWNIRKATLQTLLYVEEISDDDKDKMLTKELELTQQCLMSNPKSYGAWYQRCWSLKRMEKPDWKKEIALCNKFQSMDERNFHCWDFRRFVVSSAGITPEEELEYAMEKINTNFSNYSAWHYRSKLLPLVFGNRDGVIQITEEKRREEIDLVQNAAFTDPEDSSAWFYHTWLLGREDSGDPKLMVVKLMRDELILAFTRPLSSGDIEIYDDLKGKDEKLQLTFTNPNKRKETAVSKLWICSGLSSSTRKSTLVIQIKGEQVYHLKENEDMFLTNHSLKPSMRCTNEETLNVLRQDLQNCKDLLQLEPDSKWTRLSQILVMQTIDEAHYLHDILRNLGKLADVDPMRRGFYEDFRSQLVVDNKIIEFPSGGLIDLADLNLTTISRPERLCLVQRLDLTGNPLRNLDFVPYLICCQEIICDVGLLNEAEKLKGANIIHDFQLNKEKSMLVIWKANVKV